MADSSGPSSPPANTLPNLSALTLKPRDQLTRQASDGIYCMDTMDASQRGFKISDLSQCKSSVILIRNALNVTDEEAEELDNLLASDEVYGTTNMYNSKQILPRKQATFGAVYNFTKPNQKPPKSFGWDTEPNWPAAVKKALLFSKLLVPYLTPPPGSQVYRFDPSFYNGVHTNLYPIADSGVAEHQDKESDMVKGFPILSFTLLTGVKKPRDFVISLKELPEEYATRQAVRAEKYERLNKPKPKSALAVNYIPIASVTLGHNDLLIMQGDMQSTETGYYHSIPHAKPAKDYEGARRVNMTVRAFTVEAVEAANAAAAEKRGREE